MTRMIQIVLLIFLSYSCVPSSSTSTGEGDDKTNSASSSTNQGILQPPENLTDRSRSFQLSGWSPRFEWDSVTEASSYEVAIGTNSGLDDILGWFALGNVTSYKAEGLSLEAGQTYFTSVRAVDNNGLKGQAAYGDGWNVEICPEGYVLVPGNTTPQLGGEIYSQGTKSSYDWSTNIERIRFSADFCVMKYEAKQGDNHIAISMATGTPWVLIGREVDGVANDAQEACENNGEGFQLIGNHHWQAVARNIESVSVNFDTSGSIADHTFNRGHADDDSDSPGGESSTGALEAHSDDTKACFGIGSETSGSTAGVPVSISDDCAGGWHINKRTHEISNGNIIWDFSGNVYEWVRDDNFTSEGSNGLMQAVPYTQPLNWGPENDYSAMSGGEKAGLGHGNLNYVGLGGVSRSGWWRRNNQTGIFSTNLNRSIDEEGAALGFRCVFAP